MVKKIVFFLILICLVGVFLCFPQSSSDDCKDPPDTGSDTESKEEPSPDTPDDNYSFNLAGNKRVGISNYSERFPFIGILKNGNVIAMDTLLERIERGCLYVENDFNPEKTLEITKLLVVPSGGFTGFGKSAYLKILLEQFVRNGGTIICFAQQDSDDYSLIPFVEKETLKAYGWRQDQSCYSGSVYFKGMHPVLSSATGELVSGAVDGYFEAWPSTSTVLLNRTKNREAAMLYYPYGNGTVILTSLYTDWGYAHSQATLMELRVVRDLITFAKNPHLPIPMYDLTENVTPSINLNVNVKNNAETPAAKVKLKAYTPDRKRVLYTIEQAVGLAPGEEVEVPIQSSSSLVPRSSSLVPPSSVSSMGSLFMSFSYCKMMKGVV